MLNFSVSNKVSLYSAAVYHKTEQKTNAWILVVVLSIKILLKHLIIQHFCFSYLFQV